MRWPATTRKKPSSRSLAARREKSSSPDTACRNATMKRVPWGSRARSSATFWADSRRTSRPHRKQNTCPTRAYRSRR